MYSPLYFTYGKEWALRGPRKGGAPQAPVQWEVLSSKNQDSQSPTAPGRAPFLLPPGSDAYQFSSSDMAYS